MKTQKVRSYVRTTKKPQNNDLMPAILIIAVVLLIAIVYWKVTLLALMLAMTLVAVRTVAFQTN